jgi:hypothetical protein
MTVETRLYPYAPGERGVNFDEIIERAKKGERIGTVTSASGKNLGYILDEGHISVSDLENEYFMLSASWADETVEFALASTKIQSREKHPDMYAGKFVEFALSYFESQGKTVREIFDVWEPPSDNYKGFCNARNYWDNDFKAAKQTWSGRTYAKFGFSHVDSICFPTEQDPSVRVLIICYNPAYA